MTILVTPEQETLINDAAKADGMADDRSAWIVAHAVTAAAHAGGADTPITLTGTIAARLRSKAEAQGISAQKFVEQLVIVGGAA